MADAAAASEPPGWQAWAVDCGAAMHDALYQSVFNRPPPREGNPTQKELKYVWTAWDRGAHLYISTAQASLGRLVSEISMLLIAWSADVGCPLPWELALQIAEVSLSGSCGHGLPLSGTCCCDGAGVDQAVRVDVVHPERWLREGRSPSPRPSPITTASAAASSTVRHVLKKSRPPGRAVRGATVCSACGGWTSVVCRSKAVVTGAAAHLRPIQITCAPVRWKDCRHYQLNPDDPSVASRHRLSSWHNFRTVSLQEWVVCGQARYIVSFPQLRRPWAVAVGCITPHAAVNLHNNWAPGLPEDHPEGTPALHTAGYFIDPREEEMVTCGGWKPQPDVAAFGGAGSTVLDGGALLPQVVRPGETIVVTIDADHGRLVVEVAGTVMSLRLPPPTSERGGEPLALCVALKYSGDVATVSRQLTPHRQ